MITADPVAFYSNGWNFFFSYASNWKCSYIIYKQDVTQFVLISVTVCVFPCFIIYFRGFCYFLLGLFSVFSLCSLCFLCLPVSYFLNFSHSASAPRSRPPVHTVVVVSRCLHSPHQLQSIYSLCIYSPAVCTCVFHALSGSPLCFLSAVIFSLLLPC